MNNIRQKVNYKVGETLKEVMGHKLNYVLLAFLLLTAFFIRAYRAGDLMGFYFDQGRDAMVVWKLWHEGKLFLIGPVTGLAGIFLGPFYYYLIAPFYLLGGGDPLYPAVFLAFLSSLAILVLYIMGAKMQSRSAGIIAVFIATFSYYIFLSGRWLANPTPLLLTSMLLLWTMWEIAVNKKKYWLWTVVALSIGVSLQFEAASAVFYIPMIIVFAIWLYAKDVYFYFKRDKNNMHVHSDFVRVALYFLTAIFVFFLTLLPQFLFNLRHENILLNNFKRIFIEEKSFRSNFWDVLPIRLKYFWDVYSSKVYPGWVTYAKLFTILSALAIGVHFKELWKNKTLQVFIIFLGVPMIGFIFFQGNAGNIYDYYMTGYYLPMILLFALGLGYIWERDSGKIAIMLFFITFFALNGRLVRNYLNDDLKGPAYVSLGNEKMAVDWVYRDAVKFNEFNVDVYVPPVIPHAYDYLFLWQGTLHCGKSLCGKVDRRTEIVYVLFEQDPPHPERLEIWFSKYSDSSVIEEEIRYGGITVQRRRRI